MVERVAHLLAEIMVAAAVMEVAAVAVRLSLQMHRGPLMSTSTHNTAAIMVGVQPVALLAGHGDRAVPAVLGCGDDGGRDAHSKEECQDGHDNPGNTHE